MPCGDILLKDVAFFTYYFLQAIASLEIIVLFRDACLLLTFLRYYLFGTPWKPIEIRQEIRISRFEKRPRGPLCLESSIRTSSSGLC